MTRAYTHKYPPKQKPGPLGFGGRLYELRMARRVSRRELARSTCTSDTSVAQWENGVGFPGYWNLIELAKYFHVSVDTLMDVKGEITT